MFILLSLVERIRKSWLSKSIRLWYFSSRIEKSTSKESSDLGEEERIKGLILIN